MRERTARRPAAVGVLDALLALALGAGAAALALAAFQARHYGDGSLIRFAYRIGRGGYHRGHRALYDGGTALGVGPELALHLASALPYGAALAVLLLALRRAGIGRPAALGAALLCGTTQAAVFFATTVEVHGVQLLGASVALFALARPTRTGLGALTALAAAATALLLSHPTHIAVLPACALAVALDRHAAGRLTVRGAALAAVGLALGAAALVAGYLRVQGVGPELLADYWRPGAPRAFLWTWLVAAAPALFAVGAVGWLADANDAARVAHRRAAVVALWTAGLVAGVWATGLAERGAYYLGLQPALAWAAAGLLDRARSRAAALALAGLAAAAQLPLSLAFVRAWDRPLEPAGSAFVADLLEATGGRGVYLTTDPDRLRWAAGWSPLETPPYFAAAVGRPAAVVDERVALFIRWSEAAVALGEPLYLDPAVLTAAASDPGLGAAVDALRARFEWEPVALGAFRAERATGPSR